MRNWVRRRASQQVKGTPLHPDTHLLYPRNFPPSYLHNLFRKVW